MKNLRTARILALSASVLITSAAFLHAESQTAAARPARTTTAAHTKKTVARKVAHKGAARKGVTGKGAARKGAANKKTAKHAAAPNPELPTNVTMAVSTGIPTPLASTTQAVAIQKNAPMLNDFTFTQEGGNAKNIALGSDEGDFIAYQIDHEGKLRRYNQHTMSPNPWDLVPVAVPGIDPDDIKLDSVACASDGTLVVMDKEGKIFKYNSDLGEFASLPMTVAQTALDFLEVAVGNDHEVWAIDSHHDLYRHDGTKWILVAAASAAGIAVTLNGSVFAINKDLVDGDNTGGRIRYWNGQKWNRMPEIQASEIAAIDNDEVVIATRDGRLMYLNADQSAWMPFLDAAGQPISNVDEIAANAAGSVSYVTKDGQIFFNEEEGIANVVINAVPAVSITLAAGAPADTAAVQPAKQAITLKKANKSKKTGAKQTRMQKAKAAKSGKAAAGKVAAGKAATGKVGKGAVAAGSSVTTPPVATATTKKPARRNQKLKTKHVAGKGAAGKHAAGKHAAAGKASAKKAPARAGAAKGASKGPRKAVTPKPAGA